MTTTDAALGETVLGDADAPCLVLLHGLGSRRGLFDPIVDRLARHWRVLALDLPGFGEQPLPPEFDAGPDGYAEWVTEYLAARGIRSPHIVGSSLGGGIALELARRGIASRVTVFSPVGFWSEAERRWSEALLSTLRSAAVHLQAPVQRWLGLTPVRAALLAPTFARPLRVEVEAARADARALGAAIAFEEALGKFRTYRFDRDRPGRAIRGVDVTIAWGTRDVVLLARSQSRRARLRLPHARHLPLPGCGHLPFSDDPDACVQAIGRPHTPHEGATEAPTGAATRSRTR